MKFPKNPSPFVRSLVEPVDNILDLRDKIKQRVAKTTTQDETQLIAQSFRGEDVRTLELFEQESFSLTEEDDQSDNIQSPDIEEAEEE